MEALPLSGTLVVGLEQAVAGPLCTRLLRDLGARVVKVEPVTGDFARRWDSLSEFSSSYFMWLNRGKESLALNLAHPDARPVLDRLFRAADVVVQNMSSDALRRHDLAPESVQEINRRVVVCSISGYGQDGPYHDRKAYDLLVQGETGLIALTGSAGEPAKVSLPICDIAAGMYGAYAILAALVDRQRSGVGAMLDIGLFGATIDWLGGILTGFANGGPRPDRSGTRHNLIVPYGPFTCRDGELINFAVQSDKEWRAFCQTVLLRSDLLQESEYLTNEARLRNRNQLESIIDEEFSQLALETVMARLRQARIAHGNVNELEDVLSHPQLRHQRLMEEIIVDGKPIRTTAPAVRFPGYRPAGPPPRVGEHTDTVLTEVGFDPQEVAALRSVGAIA